MSACEPQEPQIARRTVAWGDYLTAAPSRSRMRWREATEVSGLLNASRGESRSFLGPLYRATAYEVFILGDQGQRIPVDWAESTMPPL